MSVRGQWRYARAVVLMCAALSGFGVLYAALASGLLGGAAWALARGLSGVDALGSSLWLLLSLWLLTELLVFARAGVWAWRAGAADEEATALDALVEVGADEALHQLVLELCAQTGAPAPARVALNAQVNASAARVMRPAGVQREVVIGLGLLGWLTRGELRAVLAHELAHVGQRSMALGAWVYLAHQLAKALIQEHDPLGRALTRGRAAPSALVRAPSHGLSFARGALRWPLLLGFSALARAHGALVREMELAADRAAVQVAGSAALIRALYRLEFADVCMMQAGHDLGVAREAELYTDDLFAHQHAAAAHLRALAGDETLGELVDERAWAFPAQAKARAGVHPSLREREAQARAMQVCCAPDDAAGWTLLRDASARRLEVTRRASTLAFGERALTPAVEVMAFIARGHAQRLSRLKAR